MVTRAKAASQKGKAATKNTSATATPVASADVLETAAAPAVASSIAPLPAEGEKPIGDGQELPPTGADEDLVMTHEIKAVVDKGFCRAGMRWPHDGIFTNRASWTDEQWKAITTEPQLIVREL
ncbi:MAG: hypothetical protein WAV95_15850 [Azonexus sp.]